MKVLDRYILREFLRNFLISLLFFTILLLVVRFSEKEMSSFISKHMTVLSSILSLTLQIPDFVVQVAPPSVLFATFFSLGRMAQNNEITAMKAAGVSLYRVFQPVLITAFLVAIFVMIFNDQVAIRANKRDTDLKESYSRSLDVATNVAFSSSGGRVFYIGTILFDSHRMHGITMHEFDENNNEVRREIYAAEATWKDQTWELRQGVMRTFNEEGWDETNFATKEIIVPEDPEFMARSVRDLKEMSFLDLRKMIKYKRMAGQTVRRDLVSLHHRISFPFACFIMALLGAPLFIIFGRSGTAVGFLFTMTISFLYWGIAIAVFEAFGSNGKLPPMLSCWTANFIYAAVGAVFVYKVKK